MVARPTERAPAPAAAPTTRRPLKRSEYHTLIEAGAFDDERVELLFGELSPMNSQRRSHAKTATDFHHALYDALRGRAGVQSQAPIIGANESEPEPDVAVYDPADDEGDDHPRHVWLVIEVSDSSRLKNQGPKARLYALTGIPEYWMVDLQKEHVRIMRDPEDGEYRTIATLDFYQGHRLGPARFPDVVLDLDRLVPKRPAGA